MFARFVLGRVTAAFDAVGRRDADAVGRGLAPDVHHRFAGDHALGGERHDRAAVVAWARRLHRLFPDIVFDIDRVATSGFPWALTVVVEWQAHVTPAVGPPYLNTGAHAIWMRASRVAELYAYEDSQAVVTALAVMAGAGVEEASAAPIG